LFLFLGFSFDLSPLTKKNGAYKVGTEKYDFYINVCGAVSMDFCQTDSGACQVAKRQVTSHCGSVLWHFVLTNIFALVVLMVLGFELQALHLLGNVLTNILFGNRYGLC
jgi:hypothetical protein